MTPTAQTAYGTANNQLAESTYDLAGNQTADGQGGRYSYDGDNRMTGCVVAGTQSNYSYDGSGRRITKNVGGTTINGVTTGGVTTTFVYNSGGSLIAEYGGPGPGTTNTGTSYLTTDHLGSTRVVTNNAGAVVSRHDYLPFGEEITLLSGGRTSYGAPDDTRQKFTSKERDPESNLDFFEARYFSAAEGRFTSPDEFSGGPEELYDFAGSASSNPTFYAEQTEPQSLNKYPYCYNNPLRFVDPDGHGPGSSGDDKAHAVSGGLHAFGNACLAGAAVSAVASAGVVDIPVTVPSAGALFVAGVVSHGLGTVVDILSSHRSKASGPQTPQAQAAQPEVEAQTQPQVLQPVAPQVLEAHRSGARGSTRGRHQHGEATDARNARGGEKGDSRRKGMPGPNWKGPSKREKERQKKREQKKSQKQGGS